MKQRKPDQSGSILLWSVIAIAILSVFAAEAVRLVSAKYQTALQTASWQEALLASESGIDLGIMELRKSLYPPPNTAWSGWNNIPSDGVTAYSLTAIPNAGLGGTPMTIEVNVDAPAALIDPNNGWQYYRVRATGTMPLTGPARVSDTKEDAQLRRLSLRWERFTNGVFSAHPLSAPQVSRHVEAIVRPVSSFDQAIMSVGIIDLTNQNIVIDSYDSRDPGKSTSGLYDSGKRQSNGDIATDGQLIDAGNAHIYGDVATNAGVVSGAANITGTERTDFYEDPIPIGAPSWSLYNLNPSDVTNTTTLIASGTSGSSASRYKVSSINLTGSQTLTLAGAADGSTTYIEIYVTGDLTVKGNGQLILQPGVKAKIYFSGNVDIGGNGMLNVNNQPLDLQMFGIQPAAGSSSKTVTLGGNGQIIAAVYAPNHDVTVNGGGTNGHVFGSIIGKSVKMTGVTNLHYDEALGSGGFINDYKIVSWFEDNR